MIGDIEQWLKAEPEESEIALTPEGAKHIPIGVLRDLLDEVNFQTHNFHFELYKSGQDTGIAASLELILDESMEFSTRRTFVGACNFLVKSIYPITDFVATAKSMCIKNAAADAAKRFGRHLNDDREVMPDTTKSQEQLIGKTKPDMQIQRSFQVAAGK